MVAPKYLQKNRQDQDHCIKNKEEDGELSDLSFENNSDDDKKGRKNKKFIYFKNVDCEETFFFINQQSDIRKLFYRIMVHP